VWLSTSFIGGFLAGYLGTFWSTLAKTDFFLMIAGIVAVAGLSIAVFNRPLNALLNE
jgi:proton-dependent oligopeptide transporter, POT family